MSCMSAVDDLILKAKELSPEDQARLVREVSRSLLCQRLAAIGLGPEELLPLCEAEIDQIVHEARSEVLRAHSL